MEELKKFAITKANEHPHLAGQIQELYQLCLDEIDAGESPYNEIQLCYGSINDLIEDDGEKKV